MLKNIFNIILVLSITICIIGCSSKSETSQNVMSNNSSSVTQSNVNNDNVNSEVSNMSGTVAGIKVDFVEKSSDFKETFYGISQVAKISSMQDGAVYGEYLFTFGSGGTCRVYKVEDLNNVETGTSLPTIAKFNLDKIDLIKPHANAVSFSNVFYQDGDKFPLLYSTVYNTYKNENDRKEGTCCVYRLIENNGEFSSELVQVIQIGFVDDAEVWSAKSDARPYGNFVVDSENNKLYAFTMRDKQKTTRYFQFDLPSPTDGEIHPEYGVNYVSLSTSDIKDVFDCEYHKYLQGATFHNGKIYALEGFSNAKVNLPAVRIVDPVSKKEELFVRFTDYGLDVEPELITFYNDVCFYGDVDGKIFIIEF